jgi:hypothetical protein
LEVPKVTVNNWRNIFKVNFTNCQETNSCWHSIPSWSHHTAAVSCSGGTQRTAGLLLDRSLQECLTIINRGQMHSLKDVSAEIFYWGVILKCTDNYSATFLRRNGFLKSWHIDVTVNCSVTCFGSSGHCNSVPPARRQLACPILLKY